MGDPHVLLRSAYVLKWLHLVPATVLSVLLFQPILPNQLKTIQDRAITQTIVQDPVTPVRVEQLRRDVDEIKGLRIETRLATIEATQVSDHDLLKGIALAMLLLCVDAVLRVVRGGKHMLMPPTPCGVADCPIQQKSRRGEHGTH